MNPTAKLFLTLGSLSGALAVIIGAFGAHGLKDKLCEQMLAVYKTGVEYHFYHTLALLGIGLLSLHYKSALLTASGWSMVAGIIIFFVRALCAHEILHWKARRYIRQNCWPGLIIGVPGSGAWKIDCPNLAICMLPTV